MICFSFARPLDAREHLTTGKWIRGFRLERSQGISAFCCVHINLVLTRASLRKIAYDPRVLIVNPSEGCGLFPGARVGDAVARVRELETIRQFLTSSALTLVLDLFFAGVFIGVLFIVAPHARFRRIAALPQHARLPARRSGIAPRAAVAELPASAAVDRSSGRHPQYRAGPGRRGQTIVWVNRAQRDPIELVRRLVYASDWCQYFAAWDNVR